MSPHTLLAYRRDLVTLTEFCDQGEISRWIQLDHAHIRDDIIRQDRAADKSEEQAEDNGKKANSEHAWPASFFRVGEFQRVVVSL